MNNDSHYQQAIYHHIQNPPAENKHLMVEAVAGSGKTTTIVRALDKLPMESFSLFVAFNRHIAQELKERVPFNCEASTLNSFGNTALRERFGWMKVKETKIEDILWFDVLKQMDRNKYYKSLRSVRQLVELFKAYAIFAPTTDDCDFFAERYELLINGDEYDLAMKTLKISNERTKVIDYNDQIYLPLLFDLPVQQYDYVFVDESQDLNPAQIQLVQKAVKPDGMIVAVGDSHQAIYGFRGADPEAMNNMVESLKMTRLPLSVCYRCAKNIVMEAQSEVAHIEYHEESDAGRVDYLPYKAYLDTIEAGDFILCRTTAPLVEEALRLIRSKRKAHIRGRDFGQNLMNLIKEIDTLDDYEAKIQIAYARQPATKMALQDQIDTMRVLIEMCGNDPVGIRNAIEEIFDNNGQGIVLSTIHRSKGLEAKRVFLLRPDLVPHPKATQDWAMEQEHNLRYIAITRAQKEFYYVNNQNVLYTDLMTNPDE